MKVVTRPNYYPRSVLVLSLLLVTCATLILLSKEARSTEPLSFSWATSEIVTNYSIPLVDNPQPGMCSTYYRSRQIVGDDGYKIVCISEGPKATFGAYFSSNRYTSTVGFPGSKKLFHLNIGSMCRKVSGCMYAPETDILITKQYIINSLVRSLVIYKNFSKRLTKVPGTPTAGTSYTFDSSNPDYTFKSTTDYAWPVEGIGVSDNGKWLGLEFKSRGFGILNLDTFEMKKMTNPKLKYGVGHDPSTEIAVTNDGRHMAVMGANAGLLIYDNTDECGYPATDDRMSGNLKSSEECKNASVNKDSFITRFFSALHPRFNSAGTELRFYANSLNGDQRDVSLRLAGYNPDRLDYLALGDSFSSGEGETDDAHYLDGTNDEFEKCHVSNRSYPFLLGEIFHIDTSYIKSIACSGAKSTDIIGKDLNYWGQDDRLGEGGLDAGRSNRPIFQSSAKDLFIPGRIHQISFLEDYQPKIITVGIGGNDVGFMDKLRSCIGLDTCEWAVSPLSREKTANELMGLFDKLVDTYQAIHEASPQSIIYAVGYPNIIKADGNCDGTLSLLLNGIERTFMEEGVRYINQVIRSAAERVGIKYIDIEDSLGDQRLCGDKHLAAMNGIRLGDDRPVNDSLNWIRVVGQESFHPNPTGQRLIASAIASSVGDDPFVAFCSNGKIICPDNSVFAPYPSLYWTTNGILSTTVSQRLSTVIDNNNSYRDQSLNVGDYTFEPGSTVQVEIHSTPQSLGEFTVDSLGGGAFSFTIPSDIEDGFHVIHLLGTSPIGEDLDLYQVLALQDPDIIVNTDVPSTTTAPDNSPQAKTYTVQQESTNTNSPHTYPKTDKKQPTGEVLSAKDTVGINSGPVGLLSELPANKQTAETPNYTIWLATGVLLLGGVVYGSIHWSRAFVSHRK